MKTVMISTGRVLIHTAAASPGIPREIWRYKFRTVTSRVPKSFIPRRKSIARLPRRFTTCHSSTIAICRGSGFSRGYVRDLSVDKGIDTGLGTEFAINDRPDSLDRYYGDDLGYAFQFFLRIRPSLHSHGGHEHAEHVPGIMK